MPTQHLGMNCCWVVRHLSKLTLANGSSWPDPGPRRDRRQLTSAGEDAGRTVSLLARRRNHVSGQVRPHTTDCSGVTLVSSFTV